MELLSNAPVGASWSRGTGVDSRFCISGETGFHMEFDLNLIIQPNMKSEIRPLEYARPPILRVDFQGFTPVTGLIGAIARRI